MKVQFFFKDDFVADFLFRHDAGTIVLCILVRGGTSKKGHNKGHKRPFSVCVNLKKDPNRHLRPRTNMHSTVLLLAVINTQKLHTATVDIKPAYLNTAHIH